MTALLSVLPKPSYGDACNSCGRCCIDQLCPLASINFGGSRAPCPALRRAEAGALACGLIIAPRDYRPTSVARYGAQRMAQAAALLIGAGRGCDAWDDGETVDETKRLAMLAHTCSIPRARIENAKKLWGIG